MSEQKSQPTPDRYPKWNIMPKPGRKAFQVIDLEQHRKNMNETALKWQKLTPEQREQVRNGTYKPEIGMEEVE